MGREEARHPAGRGRRMRGLVVAGAFSRFVEDDVRVLAQRYEVDRFLWSDRRDTFRLMKAVAR